MTVSKYPKTSHILDLKRGAHFSKSWLFFSHGQIFLGCFRSLLKWHSLSTPQYQHLSLSFPLCFVVGPGLVRLGNVWVRSNEDPYSQFHARLTCVGSTFVSFVSDKVSEDCAAWCTRVVVAGGGWERWEWRVKVIRSEESRWEAVGGAAVGGRHGFRFNGLAVIRKYVKFLPGPPDFRVNYSTFPAREITPTHVIFFYFLFLQIYF